MTLDDLFDDPLALHREMVASLAVPENLPQLRELLESVHEDVVAMAATLIGVVGDPDSVAALVEAFHRFPGSNLLVALLESGPQGRQCLQKLVLDESFLVSTKAWEALMTGLHRPAIRPAIFRILENLARNESALKHDRYRAAHVLVDHGWVSSWSSLEPLLGQEIVEDLFQGQVSARFPAPKSACQEIAAPQRARIRYLFMQQLTSEAQRTRQLALTYESEIERRRTEGRLLRASVGRNQACPCASGRKYKRCCLPQDEQRRRPDPWVTVYDQKDWSPVGLQRCPMEEPNAQRLLQILLEEKPHSSPIDPQDSPVAAWLIASRWLQLGDWTQTKAALRFALQETEPPGIDLGATLTTVLAKIQRDKAWDEIDSVLQIWGSRAQEYHLWILGESLAREDETLLNLLDRLVSRRAPLFQLLSLVEGALQSGADWVLAEEFCELLQLHYSREDQIQQIITEWLEHVPLRQGYEQAFPYPHPHWIERLPYLQLCQNLPLESLPEAERLLFRLEQLSTWPDANATVTEDSLEPLSDEFETRRQFQAQALNQLEEIFGEHQERALAEITLDSSLVVALTCEEAIWFVPPLASLQETGEIAAAAEALGSQLGLGEVQVANWQGRFALRQPYGDCHPQVLGQSLPEHLAHYREKGTFWWTVLPTGLPSFETSKVTFGESQGKPNKSGTLPLVGSDPDLPVSIENDPKPLRKALRKVLQRLFRLNKVGGSHSASELASRGIRPPLRDQVEESLNRLVQGGILRERLTLTGQQTLIDFKQLHRVLSFIEEGWPLHPLPEV